MRLNRPFTPFLELQGRLSSASGSRYEGEWVDDKIDGYGVWAWANGNLFQGGACWSESRSQFGEQNVVVADSDFLLDSRLLSVS